MLTARPSSLLPPSLLFLSLTTLFYLWHRISFRSLHDEALELRSSTSLFSYTISTARNIAGNRCAVLRCMSAADAPPLPRTSCDVVTLTIKPVKSASTRLCIVDYVSTHWDALSRTYNDGLFYVSPTVALRHDPAQLPLTGKAVHFPLARDSRDISPAWFSVFPSNVSASVFKAWAKATTNLPKHAAPPEHVSLNRARNCRNKDVECHPRDTAIAQACDGLPGKKECATERRPGWVVAAVVALAVMVAVHQLVDAAAGFISRRRLAALRALTGGNVGAARREALVIFMLLLGGIVLLAGLPRWPDVVRTVARPLAVSVRHRLQNVHVEDPMDAFAGAADLRGRWEGYAYIMADGTDWVRISGPGVGMVVVVVGWVMQVREAVGAGLLVRCVMMIVAVRVLCLVVKVVGSVSERRLDEDDEYVDRREAGMFRRSKDRSRSFLSQRDLAEKERGNTKSGRV